jgi:flagellin
MLGGINYVSSQISSIYNSTSQQLASSLEKIASGKKFQNASDDLLSYIRAEDIGIDISGYERVKQDLTSFKTFSTAAAQAGSSIYENLTEMKDLATQWAGTLDPDKKAEYKSDFDALKKQVTSILDNTYVDGKKVTAAAAITSASLDPDGTGKLSMTFSAIASSANVTALDITDGGAVADVQTEIDNTLTYLSEAKSFDNIASQQMNLTDTIITSKKSVQSLITDIDDAEEMAKATDLQIRQQAAIAMLSQANMSRQAIAKLYM